MNRADLAGLVVHLLGSAHQPDRLDAVAGPSELTLPSPVILSGAFDDLIDGLGAESGDRSGHLHRPHEADALIVTRPNESSTRRNLIEIVVGEMKRANSNRKSSLVQEKANAPLRGIDH